MQDKIKIHNVENYSIIFINNVVHALSVKIRYIAKEIKIINNFLFFFFFLNQ